jgi:hypothetical protein
LLSSTILCSEVQSDVLAGVVLEAVISASGNIVP